MGGVTEVLWLVVGFAVGVGLCGCLFFYIRRRRIQYYERRLEECETAQRARDLLGTIREEHHAGLYGDAEKKCHVLYRKEVELAWTDASRSPEGVRELALLSFFLSLKKDENFFGSSPSFREAALNELLPFTEKRIRETQNIDDLIFLSRKGFVSTKLERLYTKKYTLLLLREVARAESTEAACFRFDTNPLSMGDREFVNSKLRALDPPYEWEDLQGQSLKIANEFIDRRMSVLAQEVHGYSMAAGCAT